MREFNRLHPEINKKRCKNYREKYPERKKQQDKLDYQKHRQQRLDSRKNYRIANRNMLLKQAKIYRIDNPGKFLQYAIKFRKKYGITIGRALQFWSLTVKKRDKSCQICGEQAQESHHLLYQRFYPKLQLNSNNGIALCHLCHLETHGRFRT